MRRPKELCLLLSHTTGYFCQQYVTHSRGGRHPFARHTLEFDLSVSAACKRKYSDKAEQKRVILELRALGWSYREIANEVGLHWTRVGQIVKNKKAGE